MGYSQPTLLEYEFISPDQVPHKIHPVFDQTPKSFNIKNDEKKNKKFSSNGEIEVCEE